MSRPRNDDQGTDHPDYRFSLANERTFLAWIRTALALLAAGIGVVSLPDRFASHAARAAVAIVLIVLAIVAAASSYLRWRGNQAAMRDGRPLPRTSSMPVLTAGLTAVAVLALALVAFDLS